MQQTIGLKRFFNTHVGTAMVACGVLVSVTLGVVARGIPGNLPLTGDDVSQRAAPPAVVVVMSPAERAAQLQQLQRYYAQKEARLEADELERSVLAARTARQETMRRYIEHKEETLDALP